ncbi:unnamed protein product, partial [Staurois parvus]
ICFHKLHFNHLPSGPLYINGRTVAVQWVSWAIYKRPPRTLLVRRFLGARSTAIRCTLCPPDTVEHRSSDGTSLYEVPIM